MLHCLAFHKDLLELNGSIPMLVVGCVDTRPPFSFSTVLVFGRTSLFHAGHHIFGPHDCILGQYTASKIHRLNYRKGNEKKNVLEQTSTVSIYAHRATATLSRAFQRQYPRVTQHKTPLPWGRREPSI